MKKIAKLSDLKLQDGTISWVVNGKIKKVSENRSLQALADEAKCLVFVLANNGKGNSEERNLLNILSEEGILVASLPPPSEYSFLYLTMHPEVGIAVVAGADRKMDGWYDWHFGYDDQKKELFRHCPAY